MTSAPCAMGSLVEARRDGRLGDVDEASIDRHLATCVECASLARDLDRLASLARAPVAPSSALDRRRGRVRLLQGAAAPAPTPRRGSIPLIAMVAVFAVSAIAIAAVSFNRSGGATPLVASRGIAYASAPLLIARTLRDTAEDAAPAVHAAPDSIVLSDTSARSAGALSKAGSATSIAPVASEPSTARAPVRSSPDGSRATPNEPRAHGDGSAASFDDAVALVERGDYGAATESLDRFRQAHAGSPRAEDAAFLGIVALERAGRRVDAIAAARAYLAAYPHGYRRGEAEAIVAHGAGDAGAPGILAPH